MNSLSPQGAGTAGVPRSVWTKRAALALPLLCLMIFGTIIGANLIGHTAGASASSLIPLKGHVPGLIRTSTLVGPTDPNQSLSLSIGLQMRNVDSLKSFVDISTKKDSLIAHQHLTSTQIAAAYAPLASSQQSVIDYMQRYGFNVTMTLSQHLVVSFRGTIGDAENALHLQINNYRSATGQDFYAPATDPMVPASLAGLIQSVIGLDNTMSFTHASVTIEKASAGTTTSNSNCTYSGPNAYYLPSQVAQAYNLTALYNAGFQGEGQTIALFELNGFFPSDISAYTQCYGGSSVPIHTIAVDGGVPNPVNDVTKTETDMELVLSAAPHLAALDVYQAPNNATSYVDLWSQIINDNSASVVSTGWYHCESGTTQSIFQQENTLFTLAAAQGQTIFAASGDSGPVACGTGSSETNDPASQPYVTGVGGTVLSLGQNNSHYAETTWFTPDLAPGASGTNGGTSGGGVSQQWPLPSWQQGPGVLNSPYSSGIPCQNTGGFCREVPDVALNAEGYLAYCYNGWRVVTGTAAASSMWAAFMALTNEKTLHDGGFNIGFINPYLYQIDQNSAMYANDFYDIITGVTGPNNHYAATPNYDMASGLGSYNAANLANDLETLAATKNGSRQAPAAPKWYFAEGSVGGGFQEWLTVLNPSAQNATVTVQYLFSNAPAISKSYTVAAASRFTINVNSELGIPQTGGHISISAIVTSTVPVVVERPMYFNLWNTVPSGTDVLGATKTNTTFYFAQGDERQNSSINLAEFITMLNPNTDPTAAPITVTATYYSGGQQVGSDTTTIASLQRGTIAPSYKGQAAIKLTASQGIVAERPIYIKGAIPGLNGTITGAASAVGATDLGGANGSDWLFAEGHTSGTFQENLVLANFTATDTTATVKLEYSSSNGSTPTPAVLQCTVKAESQFFFNVNNPSGNGCSVQSLGTPTNNVSAEVTAPTASIVAERVMYFQFGTGPGMTDVVGQPASANQTTYSFAEGYTGGTFSEWLSLQNPTLQKETVALTFFADNMIIEKEITLPPTSRTTILVNDLINPIVNAYPAPGLHNVSMVIQALNGGSVIAERPMYFNYGGDTGGTDVIGYTGN